ncbi:uncharacterized protein LOC132162134 [Corylus avellana]|uniref:uncharacterized protein LOC132162134 n=1 Tax=Corylus avellana TaxID=13451 RepID=UPI00286B710C|nr:uncharacterized protein LOC132162134 [Corylus avellana]
MGKCMPCEHWVSLHKLFELVRFLILLCDQGYFQILFSCIEKLLAFLNVKSIVLPAAVEAESIWTDHKFGFERMKPDQLSKYRRSCCQMVTFKGTSMLQKMVRQCRVINT